MALSNNDMKMLEKHELKSKQIVSLGTSLNMLYTHFITSSKHQPCCHFLTENKMVTSQDEYCQTTFDA